MAHECDVVLLGDLVLAMDLRVARQRQPGRRGDSRTAEIFGAVTLSGEDPVKAARFLESPREIEVRVDGPPGAGAQLRRVRPVNCI
jgi:hypothetical protein